MFCHQCEQAAKGIGCSAAGVCGKQPDIATLQDHLLYGLQSLSFYPHKAHQLGAADHFVLEGLFATVTTSTSMPSVS